MKAISDFLKYILISVGEYKLSVYTILIIIGIFIMAKFVIWLLKKALIRSGRKDSTNSHNFNALFQIIKYVIWVIAISFILEAVGISVTVLLAGSAALLVGVGLGLQQTFNDIISGIILLSERSIKVGDILEIDDDVVRIMHIGLRTSEGLNRDEISIIIPNSLITNNKVVNWSHQAMKTRFKVSVGVAYGSPVDKVMQILKESANEHPQISDDTLIEVRLVDFGNSSLDFHVLFFSDEIFKIEKVKSEIREIISRKFLENNISIPFPQMDVYLKTNGTVSSESKV